MPVTPTPAFTQAITTTQTVLLNATSAQSINASGVPTSPSTMLVSISPVSTNGSVIKSINITTNNTAALTLYLWQYSGSVYSLLGTVIVPITSGFGASGAGAVASYDVLADPYMTTFAIDQSGKPTLLLPPSYSLVIGTKAQIVSGLAAWITVTREDF